MPHLFKNSRATGGLPTGRYLLKPMLCTTTPLYTGKKAAILFLSILHYIIKKRTEKFQAVGLAFFRMKLYAQYMPVLNSSSYIESIIANCCHMRRIIRHKMITMIEIKMTFVFQFSEQQ